MKLRNKEHRDIIADFQGNWSLRDEGDKVVLKNDVGVSRYEYTSLEQLTKEWQTIKEPLLKGELKESLKIWAELNNFTKVEYHSYSSGWSNFTAKTSKGYYITYEIGYELPDFEEKEYDIKELVGTE